MLVAANELVPVHDRILEEQVPEVLGEVNLTAQNKLDCINNIT